MKTTLRFPLAEVQDIDPARYRVSLVITSENGPISPAEEKALTQAAQQAVAACEVDNWVQTSAPFAYSYEVPLPDGLDSDVFETIGTISRTDGRNFQEGDSDAIEAALAKRKQTRTVKQPITTKKKKTRL